jgi:hypothetical protein
MIKKAREFRKLGILAHEAVQTGLQHNAFFQPSALVVLSVHFYCPFPNANANA